MELKKITSGQDFIRQSARFMNNAVHDSLEYRMPARVAVSGGSTPGPIYRAFATEGQFVKDLRLCFYEVDERYVPYDHPDSNAKMLEEQLFRPLGERTDVQPLSTGDLFQTSRPIAEAVTRYEEELLLLIKWYGFPFHLAILGLGSDGHTASLFPHSPALHETKRLVAHTTTDQFAIRDRLTLTFPAIMASKKLLLLVKGKEKEQIMHDLLHSDKNIDELPAKKLLEHPDLTIHYCTN